VLDLGCGHGLPGLVALQRGAAVDFLDYNREVRRPLRPCWRPF
jgi:16S rRNA G1207 methylase RsmC